MELQSNRDFAYKCVARVVKALLSRDAPARSVQFKILEEWKDLRPRQSTYLEDAGPIDNDTHIMAANMLPDDSLILNEIHFEERPNGLFNTV